MENDGIEKQAGEIYKIPNIILSVIETENGNLIMWKDNTINGLLGRIPRNGWCRGSQTGKANTGM